MRELQEFTKGYQRELKWHINDENYRKSRESLLNNYMLLTTEVAEIAEEFRKAFNLVHKASANGTDPEEAFNMAKAVVKEDLGKEIADCMAYLCKFANFFEIDMEDSFYEKMAEVKARQNKDVKLPG